MHIDPVGAVNPEFRHLEAHGAERGRSRKPTRVPLREWWTRVRPRLYWRLEIAECGYFPPTHGIAYWRWDCRLAVCYPLGVHLVVSVARWAYVGLRLLHAPDLTERAYMRGRADGLASADLSAAVRIESAERVAFTNGVHAERERARADQERIRAEIASIAADLRSIREGHA